MFDQWKSGAEFLNAILGVATKLFGPVPHFTGRHAVGDSPNLRPSTSSSHGDYRSRLALAEQMIDQRCFAWARQQLEAVLQDPQLQQDHRAAVRAYELLEFVGHSLNDLNLQRRGIEGARKLLAGDDMEAVIRRATSIGDRDPLDVLDDLIQRAYVYAEARELSKAHDCLESAHDILSRYDALEASDVARYQQADSRERRERRNRAEWRIEHNLADVILREVHDAPGRPGAPLFRDARWLLLSSARHQLAQGLLKTETLIDLLELGLARDDFALKQAFDDVQSILEENAAALITIDLLDQVERSKWLRPLLDVPQWAKGITSLERRSRRGVMIRRSPTIQRFARAWLAVAGMIGLTAIFLLVGLGLASPRMTSGMPQSHRVVSRLPGPVAEKQVNKALRLNPSVRIHTIGQNKDEQCGHFNLLLAEKQVDVMATSMAESHLPLPEKQV